MTIVISGIALHAIGMNQLAIKRPDTMTHPGELSWVTLSTIDKENWFVDNTLASSTAKSLHSCLQQTNAQVLAWVLLPDQLQILLQAGSNCCIQDAIQKLKVSTAIAVNKAAHATLGIIGPLWQVEHQIQAIYRRDCAQEVGMNIIRQPQRLGLVENYSHYPYWDTIWT